MRNPVYFEVEPFSGYPKLKFEDNYALEFENEGVFYPSGIRDRLVPPVLAGSSSSPIGPGTGTPSSSRPAVTTTAEIEGLPEATRRQAGVSLEETHHIATRFRAENRAILESVGLHIDNKLNLIKNFGEHGQLRGWYDWKNRAYRYYTRGHHPDYNRWVTNHLRQVAPAGLRPDQALRNIVEALQRLERIIRQYPDVLQYGPGILPPQLQRLTPKRR